LTNDAQSFALTASLEVRSSNHAGLLSSDQLFFGLILLAGLNLKFAALEEATFVLAHLAIPDLSLVASCCLEFVDSAKIFTQLDDASAAFNFLCFGKLTSHSKDRFSLHRDQPIMEPAERFVKHGLLTVLRELEKSVLWEHSRGGGFDHLDIFVLLLVLIIIEKVSFLYANQTPMKLLLRIILSIELLQILKSIR